MGRPGRIALPVALFYSILTMTVVDCRPPMKAAPLLAGIFLLATARAATGADTVVIFSEIMYHPAAATAAAEEAAEWLELHNQLAVDVDMSGWSLAGGVDFVFPNGTIILAGTYLTVAAVPANVPGSVGPWTGKLSNSGERIELRNNNGRVMDEISYGTDGDWSSAPDGGGASLAKRSGNLASSDPASWRSSGRTGGTPGAENFNAFLPPVITTLSATGASWKYEASGGDQGTAWRAELFADGGWATGTAAFRLGSEALPSPAVPGTSLPSGPGTYYFRRSFNFEGNPAFTSLRVRLLADDGAAVYLNGSELARAGLPSGALTWQTPASVVGPGGLAFREMIVPGTLLHQGANVLAVELHQAGPLPSYPAAVMASAPVMYLRLSETGNPALDLASDPAAPQSGPQNGTFGGLPAANLGRPGPQPSDTVGGQPLLGFDGGNAAPLFQGGTDVVTVPDPGVFNFSTGKKFSLEAWVKGPPAQEGGGAIIAKGTGGGGEQFAIDVTTGFRFFAWNGAVPNAPWVAQSSVLPNNTWQHVVAVYDQSANIARLYVNTAQVASVTPSATLVNNTHEVSIGARKNSGSSAYDLNFSGTVDEAAIYNRPLSVVEITAHYNAAFAASPTTPLDTTDAVFDLELVATETIPAGSPPALVLNEVSLTGVEIRNNSSAAIDLTGGSLRRVTSTGTSSIPLPDQSLAAGGVLTLPLALTDGDRIILLGPDGVSVLDSFEVKDTPRSRYPDGTGNWMRPSAETPNAVNTVTLHNEIVINEIMYDHPSATLLAPAAPQPGQWIELHNKSGAEVELSGWRLTRAVDFTFPAPTLLAAGEFLIVAENPAAAIAGHGIPAAKVFGPWSGNLSHSSDRIVLEDAAGNPADDVTFFSEGRWPAAANAGGSSLELRDPDADNNVAESWAASDESNDAAWQTFTWSGPNVPSQAGEPTRWNELALLLVDGPGECLIDDVRVTDTTTTLDLLQTGVGNFSSGGTGWRFLGNHRTSRVEDEPGNPGNKVLHVIASGPGEYQGNQIETTYVSNQALVPNRIYEISLRARWLSGAGRLNTRLYFNRLPRTNLLSVVSNGGTPAAPNSRLAANIGPALTNLAHTPVVPAANQPVVVSVEAADPDGVGGVNLKYSASGGAWQTVAMTSAGGRHFSGQIPGQPSGVIQFYVEGTDTLTATSLFPGRGVNSRALIQVQDGQAAGTLQKVRLIMTAADANYMHTGINTLSNEYLGATVLVNESEVFYDAGARLKGSFVGRNVSRVGFTLRFNSDRLFRGVHDKIAIDRSQHVAVAQGEIIAKHIAAHAGGIPEMYDDLGRFIHTLPGYSSSCQMRIAGFDEVYLDGQFPNGSNGTMFEIEVIRWHTTTTVPGDPTSPKAVGGGDGYANLELQNWGNDKEAYRWTALQSSNRDRDDFTSMIALEKMFGLTPGAAFNTEAQQRLDYEQWLRTMAYMSLVGPGDAVYTGGNLHNYRLYFRPHDGRAMFMPWDWDSSYQRATNASLVGGSNIAKVVNASPDTLRRYYCHLYDIIQSTFNSTYMTRWTTHYGNVVGEGYGGIQSYINSRAAFVLSQLPTATAFTANAGTVSANGAVTITGNAAISVAFIEVNGLAYTPAWTSTIAWSITVPLAGGANSLTIRGLTKDGAAVSGATATLNVNNPNAPGWPALRINEWMSENDGSVPDPTDGAGDDWFEIHNSTGQPVSLAGWKLSDTPSVPSLFTIPTGWTIPANGFLLVWADNEPVQNPSSPVAASALHVNFRLNNGGETILLTAPDNREIDRVDFGEQTADDTDGRYPDSAPAISRLTIPSPGSTNVLAAFTQLNFFSAVPDVTLTTTPGWTYQMESSADLASWLPFGAPLTASGPLSTLPAPADTARRFVRVRVGP